MPTSAVPVIDTAQLDRRALGDESLRVEILALFATEVERLLRQVEDAPDAQIRGDRLRAMTALARNVGAVRLGHVARQLETEIAAEAIDFAPLRQATQETLAYLGQAKV